MAAEYGMIPLVTTTVVCGGTATLTTCAMPMMAYELLILTSYAISHSEANMDARDQHANRRHSARGSGYSFDVVRP